MLDLTPTVPVHTELWNDEGYGELDPGIRYPVRLLHAHGIRTCQSCEGGKGHSYRCPSIDMQEGRAFEAMTVLERNAIPVRGVSSIWRIEDGVPNERIWRIELRQAIPERADERPMFISGHLHRGCWADTEEASEK